MNFQDSLSYLLKLGNEVSSMKLGLENIGKLLAALRNPEKKYLKVQVAGTNGKGSTCAFLESICLSARIKTGLYTSPHLISITERIKINGEEISENAFAEYATKIKDVSEQLVLEKKLETVPTFFEQVTAIALYAFAEAKIELAILETGLGGRFDATTAANAEIAAITPIDFDHQQFLGDTLTEIAGEKAAIIRVDTKVIYAPQKSEVERVILEKCRKTGVIPEITDSEIQIKKQFDESGFPFLIADFTTENETYTDVILGLNGRHQFINASLAINISEILKEFGFDISKNDVSAGLAKAVHRGRLEFYENILFDGAHNVAGAAALREYLDEFAGQPVTLIFGAMKDKDLKEIAEILFPKATNIIFTEPDNSRSVETAELIKYLPETFDLKNVFQSKTAEEALNIATTNFAVETLICVTGSLYLVGEIRKLLMQTDASRFVV